MKTERIGTAGENDHVQSVTTETETDVAIAETSDPVDGQYSLEGGILYYKIYNETHLANPLLTPGSGSWKKEKSP